MNCIDKGKLGLIASSKRHSQLNISAQAVAEKGLAVAERAKQEAEGLRSLVEGMSLREGAVPLEEEEEEEEGYCSALTM